MRVIAGEFRSRRLKTLPGLETRPTPDRLRETLFNILAPRMEGTIFLDAYAGTGAVGIEALSRGARRAIFVDRRRPAVEVIRENLASLDLTGRAEVYCGKALQVIERVQADIVFLDPPYELEREYEAALTALGLSTSGLVIVQHFHKLRLENSYGALSKGRTVKQGDNVLSVYAPRTA
jgi:16S rRNA (guanine966-N2)-methyltransferase